MRPHSLFLLAFLACGGASDEQPLDTIDSVRVTRPLVVDRDSLPELDIPAADRSEVALHAAGSLELDVSAEYRATYCEENPSTILVEADGPLQADERWGLVLVITVGDSGYTVTRREGGIPDPGTIQAAVQRIIPTSANRFQAIDGTVAIQLADSTLSGSLDLIVRAWEGRNLARLVGALGRQKVSAAASGNCRFDEPAD